VSGIKVPEEYRIARLFSIFIFAGQDAIHVTGLLTANNRWRKPLLLIMTKQMIYQNKARSHTRITDIAKGPRTHHERLSCSPGTDETKCRREFP
jgi:hypothetical protein